MTLGEKLIALRGEKTRKQMAKEIGINVQIVQKWEKDYHYPRVEALFRLAKYYGITVSELLYGVSE